MACAICKTRREKRHCPGVHGEICAICCGEEREQTVSCPLNCEYLRYAHQHDIPAKDPAGVPNRDVPIPRNFLNNNIELILELEQAMLAVALNRNAIDNDARDALDGLVRTYQTMASGLYYESRPSNPIAAAIFDAAQDRVAAIRKHEGERGEHHLRDSHILNVLIFLQRMEYALNSGRKRGRCFLGNVLDSLIAAGLAPPEEQGEPSSSLIIS